MRIGSLEIKVPDVLRAAKARFIISKRYAAWRTSIKKLDADDVSERRTPFSSILIVPSDPEKIVGSRGDDAMVSTVIAEARRRNSKCRVGVVCCSEKLSPILEGLDVKAEPIFMGDSYDAFLATIERYDALTMIGADVMDGHYSVRDALRYWSFADLAARKGLRSSVLGFSFSAYPAPELNEILRSLSRHLKLYAREAASQRVIDELSAVKTELVADSAFLLPPKRTAPDQAMVDEWSIRQRASGNFICAINTHPMVFKDRDMGKVAQLNAAFRTSLVKLAKQYAVSYLLVPHDFRDGSQGDGTSLGPLNDMLFPELGDRVLYAKREARAAELKSLVASADLLVTGRMHLGVGALSMGVPIWAVSPQDKFIGLFAHFGLDDLRLVPELALNEMELEEFLRSAFVGWPGVRDSVRAALPAVKSLAQKNFQLLDA